MEVVYSPGFAEPTTSMDLVRKSTKQSSTQASHQRCSSSTQYRYRHKASAQSKSRFAKNRNIIVDMLNHGAATTQQMLEQAADREVMNIIEGAGNSTSEGLQTIVLNAAEKTAEKPGTPEIAVAPQEIEIVAQS